MVRGLDNFKEYFKDYNNQYIIIGGTACSLNFDEIGLEYRSTKDIDLVFVVEAITNDFVNKFWDYINNGEYRIKEKSSGKKIFYRFSKPEKKEFPEMIEIFSINSNILEISFNQRIIPVISDKGLESLSALLLEKSYYDIIISRKKYIDDIPIVDEICLIILKIKAYLDLSERKRNGELIDNNDINKHKKDVFRLYFALNGSEKLSVPEEIKQTIRHFLIEIKNDQQVLNSICKVMDVDNVKIETIEETIENIFLK